MDDEQVPKISSEISPHINDKQLGRLNSYGLCAVEKQYIRRNRRIWCKDAMWQSDDGV